MAFSVGTQPVGSVHDIQSAGSPVSPGGFKTINFASGGVTNAGGGIATVASPSGAPFTVVARLINTSLSSTDAGKMNTNTGAGAPVALTLPALVLGARYFFSVTEANYLRINNFDASTTISLGSSTSVAGGFVRSNVVGARLEITAVSSTQWFAVVTGSWSVDS